MPAADVRQVLTELAAHPVERLLYRWNWKTATLTAAIRGTIFFTATVPAGLGAAAEVLARDLLFRVPLGGFYGAISQAFSNARPPWAVYLVVMVLVPALSHLAEFLVHWIGGTPRLGTAITASISFSALSAVFNLFLMRRGVLVVGGSAGGLGDDLRRMPRLLLEFVIWLPLAARRGRSEAAPRTAPRTPAGTPERDDDP